MIRMQNFPKSWVLPAAIEDLPSKLQALLSRFGDLLEAPELAACSGPGGTRVLIATAVFATAGMARSAVATLHGIDMRSEAEKESVGYQPPGDAERFWAQVLREQPRIRHRSDGNPAANWSPDHANGGLEAWDVQDAQRED